ncbi:hypothetical protein V8F20_010821 [Naviculisporaceae sp. PSN 640]
MPIRLDKDTERATPRQRDRIQANHGLRRSNTTSSSPPSSSSHRSHHHAPFSNHYVYGLIMWLPPEKEEVFIDDHPYTTSTGLLCGLDSGCYDHPVLVLSPVSESSLNIIGTTDSEQDRIVTVLMITSFGGRDLLKKFPSPSSAAERRAYLPISPANQHPDLVDLPVLKLEGNLDMAKKCYVDVTQRHNIPRRALRQYRKKGNRRRSAYTDLLSEWYVLTRESYLIVAQQSGYIIPVVSAPVSLPAVLPSPPPSPSTPRRARRQFSLPPTSFAQRVGVDGSRAREFLAPLPRPQRVPTLFENFQAERVRPDVLNPGRGTRVAATRTEVTPLLPVHNYHRIGRVGRSDSPLCRARAGYYNVGGESAHPQTRQVLVALCFILAFLAGTGYGVWAAWIYRAAIGRGLLFTGRWVVEQGWAIIRIVLKFGLRILSWAVKWVAGAAKGAAEWVWERLKGLMG